MENIPELKEQSPAAPFPGIRAAEAAGTPTAPPAYCRCIVQIPGGRAAQINARNKQVRPRALMKQTSIQPSRRSVATPTPTPTASLCRFHRSGSCFWMLGSDLDPLVSPGAAGVGLHAVFKYGPSISCSQLRRGIFYLGCGAGCVSRAKQDLEFSSFFNVNYTFFVRIITLPPSCQFHEPVSFKCTAGWFRLTCMEASP